MKQDLEREIKVSDAELVAFARSSDSEAFAELFGRYYSMVYGLAYRLCGHSQDAEDVAQETFVRAARALGALDIKTKELIALAIAGRYRHPGGASVPR